MSLCSLVMEYLIVKLIVVNVLWYFINLLDKYMKFLVMKVYLIYWFGMILMYVVCIWFWSVNMIKLKSVFNGVIINNWKIKIGIMKKLMFIEILIKFILDNSNKELIVFFFLKLKIVKWIYV